MSFTQRHPFASTRYARFSRSTESLGRWLRQEKGTDDIPPVPALPSSVSTSQPMIAPPQPPRPASVEPTVLPSHIGVDVPSFTSKSSPGHYVKHSSRVTVLLSGQDHETEMPEYTNSGTIDGILAVPRPAGLLGLEVKVEGKIRMKEVAGSGSSEQAIMNDSLFTWDAERNAPFPSKVTFRYTLPTHYTNRETGDRFRIPPTYEAQLNGIPGFKVEVSYAIVVCIARTRDKLDLWRKHSRLRIPFKYVELSRPSTAGPFPPSPSKKTSLPQTVFSYMLKARRASNSNIKVEVFLPASQVCSMSDSIPFYITLMGDEDTLAPFAPYRPVRESFHPLSSPGSSSGSLPQQLLRRTANPSFPAEVYLQRRTQVDVMEASEVHLTDKSHLLANKYITAGVIQSCSRSAGSLTWSGAITVPSSLSSGGFRARGIQVKDYIGLRIMTPRDSSVEFVDFSETIPVRLTTEPYDCYSAAVTVISDW